MQALARDKATIGTRQEHKASGDLARLPRPPHRACELLLGLLGHGRRDQGRPDGARTHGVDADAVLDLLVGEAAREGDDGAFRGGVVEEVGTADVRVDGGAGDDGVAALHLWEGVFGEEEEGVDVCVEGGEPLIPICCFSMGILMLRFVLQGMYRGEEGLLGDVRNGFLHHLNSVVQNQDVDAPHVLDGFLNHTLASLSTPQIGLDQMHLSPLFPN
jgi:hypothetical protein